MPNTLNIPGHPCPLRCYAVSENKPTSVNATASDSRRSVRTHDQLLQKRDVQARRYRRYLVIFTKRIQMVYCITLHIYGSIFSPSVSRYFVLYTSSATGISPVYPTSPCAVSSFRVILPTIYFQVSITRSSALNNSFIRGFDRVGEGNLTLAIHLSFTTPSTTTFLTPSINPPLSAFPKSTNP